MKKSIVLFVMIVISSLAYSQDLIVTTEGDTINCKISKVKTDNIYFTFKHKDEVRNTLLPLSALRVYKYNYFNHSEIPEGKVTKNDSYSQVIFSIIGGYSYRIASIPDSYNESFKEYTKDLKSGYNYNIELAYFFSETVGLGLKYNAFKSSNSVDNVSATDAYGNVRHGKISDNITVSFIGPFASTRFFNSKKNGALILNFGLGYLGYKDKSKVLGQEITVKGSTLGTSMDVGYDIRIGKKTFLALMVSGTFGTLSKVKVDDGSGEETIELDKDDYESLGRLDFSVGLRFVL